MRMVAVGEVDKYEAAAGGGGYKSFFLGCALCLRGLRASSKVRRIGVLYVVVFLLSIFIQKNT